MKTTATITVNGTPREITFTEGLSQAMFYEATEETQNFILRLASAQAFIAFGKRYAEHQMKELKIDYSAVQFPATMTEFIAWGQASTRGASPTKSALDAAETNLERLQAAYDDAVGTVSAFLAASDFTNPQLPVAHAAMKAAESARDAAKAELATAKKAHEAALAAKPKKPRKSKPVAEMTAEEAAKELAELEGSDDENNGDAEESAE